jgi:hypothetical protein
MILVLLFGRLMISHACINILLQQYIHFYTINTLLSITLQLFVCLLVCCLLVAITAVCLLWACLFGLYHNCTKAHNTQTQEQLQDQMLLLYAELLHHCMYTRATLHAAICASMLRAVQYMAYHIISSDSSY